MTTPDTPKAYDPDHDMLLRDRVFRFIQLHPAGIEITALETEFHESRVRLGYIINKMIEEGRITRTCSFLYPATSILI